MVLIFIAAVLLGRFRLNGSRRTLLKFAAVVILALDNLYSAVLTMAVESVSTGGFATWTFAADGVVGSLLRRPPGLARWSRRRRNAIPRSRRRPGRARATRHRRAVARRGH